MDIDKKIVTKLRSMRDEGYTTTEMINALIPEIKNRDNGGKYIWLHYEFFIAFRKAFKLGLKEAMPIIAWQGFNSGAYGGDISDSDLNRQIDSLIHK